MRQIHVRQNHERHADDTIPVPVDGAALAAAAPGVAPELPLGAPLELAGRGIAFVRSVPGPPGAPVVLLLHGWTASADLNWYRCFEPLGRSYRVLAPDQRGHGRGIRSRRIFRLEDCADDAVAVLDALGLETCIPVGYSMGGAVAQLVARRHPDRVDGLVLGATATHFSRSRQERLSFLGISGLAALARLTPAQARRWLTAQIYLQRKVATWEPWAIEEATRHDWRTVLEAGRAIGAFDSRAWSGELDTPTSVIITMRDRVVPVRRQIQLFEVLPRAEAFRVDGDHDAVVANAARFVPTLLSAIESVRARAASERAVAAGG